MSEWDRCVSGLEQMDRYGELGVVPALAVTWIWRGLLVIAAAIGLPAVYGAAKAAPRAAEQVVGAVGGFVSGVLTWAQWLIIGYGVVLGYQMLPSSRRTRTVRAVDLARQLQTKRETRAAVRVEAAKAKADLASRGVVDPMDDLPDADDEE